MLSKIIPFHEKWESISKSIYIGLFDNENIVFKTVAELKRFYIIIIYYFLSGKFIS